MKRLVVLRIIWRETSTVVSRQVDDYASELLTEDYRNSHVVTLSIHDLKHSMECSVLIDGESRDTLRIDHEMEAIIASFHIEKVVGDKR